VRFQIFPDSIRTAPFCRGSVRVQNRTDSNGRLPEEPVLRVGRAAYEVSGCTRRQIFIGALGGSAQRRHFCLRRGGETFSHSLEAALYKTTCFMPSRRAGLGHVGGTIPQGFAPLHPGLSTCRPTAWDCPFAWQENRSAWSAWSALSAQSGATTIGAVQNTDRLPVSINPSQP